MKTIVTQHSFVESFRACGRESQFTRAGLCALFDHLERLEEDTDTELELDPIALCCDWQEFDTALAAAQAFGYRDGVDSKEETPLEWLQNRTQAIEFSFGVLVNQF